MQILASPFENLNFEDAVIGTPVDNQLPSSEALPSWSNGNYNPGYVLYDQSARTSVAVGVNDGLSPNEIVQPFEGKYSVALLDDQSTGAWISQTGDVPPDARSMLFSSDFIGGANLVVSLNGTPIPTSLYSTGPVINERFGPVKTYIGDVSAFAGQSDVVLRFEAVPTGGPVWVAADLDAITFSTVPEPSSLALVAIGAVTTCLYLLRCRFAGRSA